MKNKNLSSFLVELKILTEVYNVKIEGCGCCGSPLLTQEIGDMILGHTHLNYTSNNDGVYEYQVNEQKITF